MKNVNVLKKYLAPEFLALYQISKMKRLDGDLARPLRYAVQEMRNALKSTGKDRLALKLEDYGNDGQWGRAKISELARLIYQGKAPGSEDLGQWVSVEIECVLPNKQAETNFVLFCRKNGFSRYVTIKNDGSISAYSCECDSDEGENCDSCGGNSSAFGREIILTFKVDNVEFLYKVCAELARQKATVNKTCGLHVHFDCRPYDSRQVTIMAKRVALTVPALKQMLPQSRQNNSYCQDVINSMKRGSRYCFVNLHSYRKYQTLEIRGHSGTIDPTKIINWIKLIRILMASKNTKQISTVPELVEKFDLGEILKGYCLERYRKFQGISVPVSQGLDISRILQLQSEFNQAMASGNTRAMASDDVSSDQIDYQYSATVSA